MNERAGVDKRGERVKLMFAGVARRYDLLNHVLSLNIDKSWRSTTLKRVPPIGSAPILDVCTGTGDLALGYRRLLDPGSPVIGADFCPPMLQQARNKDVEEGVVWIEADAQALPFADDVFQIVSVAFGLRNVADTRLGLSEMTRVCQPGGRVAILEFSRPRIPGISALYLAYFKYLLPWIGQWVSRSHQQAYHYLPASVLTFPDGQEMLDLMTEAGLTDVRGVRLTLGIATLYVGSKSAH